ncbi:MAG TPA: F0F1 ATP synthase subunit gamma [Candidatus Acidoferrales bacterium]|nr:F0F1 ATP synthase subunit gamma [Candidatus Acidoferrales bacterium]
MNYLKTILTQIEDLTGIKDIVGASEEIASMKMRAIRNKVLLSRDVNDELTEIYREVTISYKNQIVQLMQEKKGHNIFDQNNPHEASLKVGNGKLACVYLSANSGLFSKILENTYNEFVTYLNAHKEAVPIIIGDFGRRLFMENYPGRQFFFYPLAEDQSSEKSVKKVTEDLTRFSNVIIFYARFESMSSQTTTVLDVSGRDSSIKESVGRQILTSSVHYLFEPSLEKIIAFFESEIFAGIIQQTVTESELARYASRITTLDMARENINQQLKTVNLEKRFALHRMMNKKQTDAITGISMWKLA